MRRRGSWGRGFYHFARLHRSLRWPVPENARLPSGLIRPKPFQRAPGIPAGLGDPVGTFGEVLTTLSSRFGIEVLAVEDQPPNVG